jgi:hypothetical protein
MLLVLAKDALYDIRFLMFRKNFKIFFLKKKKSNYIRFPQFNQPLRVATVFPNWIRISSSWRLIGESHVVRSWPLMKSNGEKSVSRFCVIETQ